MGMKNETALAYALAFILLAVAIVCYAAFRTGLRRSPYGSCSRVSRERCSWTTRAMRPKKGMGLPARTVIMILKRRGPNPRPAAPVTSPMQRLSVQMPSTSSASGAMRRAEAGRSSVQDATCCCRRVDLFDPLKRSLFFISRRLVAPNAKSTFSWFG